MATLTRTLLTRGFGQPAGVLGRVGGRLMARGNGPTERHMIALAELQPGQTVVLVGPGPGIGVQAALAARAARVIAVDPSPVMLAACRRRCAGAEGVELECVAGTAADTDQGDQVADVVVTVNNIFLWPDRAAGLAELHRILRPGGRLLVSAHDKWLPEGRAALADQIRDAGFTDVQTWTWEPPGRGATLAAQLRALRPA